MALFESAFYICIALCGRVYVRRVVPGVMYCLLREIESTVCQNRNVTLCHVEIELRLTKFAVARVLLNEHDCTDVK